MTERAFRRTRMSESERRESILAAALEVFAEDGYARGSTATVAQMVGVKEPVLLKEFTTKAALFAAVVDRAAEDLCYMLDRMTASTVPITHLLHTMLDPRNLNQVQSAGTVGALFADAAAITGEPEIETAARTSTQRFAESLTILLERGRADGELRPDLDTEAAAWWLLSLVSSQRFRRTTAPAPTVIEGRLAANTLAFLTSWPAR